MIMILESIAFQAPGYARSVALAGSAFLDGGNMAKRAPDQLMRALKDDAELLNEVVRMLPAFDVDADENTLQSTLHLAQAAARLLEELLEEKNSGAAVAYPE